MKKLFMKELREEMKAALPGMALFIFILTMNYKSYANQLNRMSLDQDLRFGSEMQPLLGPVLPLAVFFCAIFGIVLGWLQIRAEKHPDLRGFLIHRPMTRTTILLGKIAAGLCLYALGAGLPLLGFIAFVRAPGHVPAPFEWAMTLPVAAIFLLGIVFYFAGMLTGLRQARWYGSRGFGLGLAIFAALELFALHEFWQALLAVAIAGGILALAAWGSFQSGGYYRSQPMPGKLALTAACVAAGFILVWAVIIFIESQSRRTFWPYYAVAKDGVVYKVIHHDIEQPEIVDLNGKPLLDDKTGGKMKFTEFDQNRAPSCAVSAHFGTLDERRKRNLSDYYWSSFRFFNPWLRADKTVWYETHDGRLAGYDLVTRRQTGTLEAPGNSINASSAAAGFIPSSANYQYSFHAPDQARILASSTTVYLVNTENRALKPIFTVTNGDIIGGYAEIHTNSPQSVVVVTRQSIQMLDFDGRVEWSVPYQPSYPVYSKISVFFLEPTHRFAVEFYPDDKADKKSGWKLPTRIEWLTSQTGISKSMDLPKLPRSMPDFGEKMGFLLMPPLPSAAVACFYDSDWPWEPSSLIPVILCAIVGWGLGRRYSFSARAQVGWGVFHLLFGLPGLLAFLSVQEWPARELCPGCKKLRVVDREKCPHCGADFAPPEKNGTEIFAPLAAD
jgi:hypothetical protein